MASDREDRQWEEPLSALADGEVDRAECSRLVERLLRDEDLQRRWERFHIVRACMQGATAATVRPGFPARVHAAVTHEPAIAVSAAKRAARRSRRRRLAGAAIAASVALIAVSALVVLQQGDLERASPATGMAGSGEAPVNDARETTPLAGADIYGGRGSRTNEAMRERLSLYLLSHNRFAQSRNMPALIPASRLAGFNAGP